MTNNLPSQLQINDEVTFRPMYRHQQSMGIADQSIEGKIVAIRFTEAKIFYDIFSSYFGKIFDEVDSIKVWQDNPAIIDKPQQN